jgi:hypothetical protein
MADFDVKNYETLGTDIDVTPDLSENEILRVDVDCLLQDLINGWTQPTGIADGTTEGAQWGIDLRSYLNRGLTKAGLFALKSSLENQAERDDRVSQCVVSLTADTQTNKLTVFGTVYIGFKPYPFSFSVSPSTVGDLWVERLN